MDQRKLIDNSSTITDMAKVRIGANEKKHFPACKARYDIATASERDRMLNKITIKKLRSLPTQNRFSTNKALF